MTRARVLLVAAALSALAGLGAGQAPPADAAWTAAGPGSGVAVAARLAPVDGVRLGEPQCEKLRVSWPASGLPARYLVQWDTSPDFTSPQERLVDGTATALPVERVHVIHVRVRAVLGTSWRGPFGPAQLARPGC